MENDQTKHDLGLPSTLHENERVEKIKNCASFHIHDRVTETNPAVFWKNVEVSVFFMRIGTDGAAWGGCVIGARSGPNGHGEGDPCTATTCRD